MLSLVLFCYKLTFSWNVLTFCVDILLSTRPRSSGQVRPRYTAVNRFQLYGPDNIDSSHITQLMQRKKFKAPNPSSSRRKCCKGMAEKRLVLQAIASNRSFVYFNLKCLRYNNFTGIFQCFSYPQKRIEFFLSFSHCWFHKFNWLGNDCLDSATVPCVRCSTLSTVHRLCRCKQLAASWVLHEVRSALLHEMKG
jgi:hypothetical protein